MAKDPPSQRYGVASSRFWRNVVLIALAHVALIAGLIRWSVAARASTNAESIVWLGGAEVLALGQSENEQAPSMQREDHPDETKRLKDDQLDEEKPVVTTAKSEIELPSPTPTPTTTPAPRPKTTPSPTPKPKTTPKPLPKATTKKTLVAKTSPKPLPKTRSSEKSEKK